MKQPSTSHETKGYEKSYPKANNAELDDSSTTRGRRLNGRVDITAT